MNSVDAHTSSDPRLRILFSVLACIVLALLPLVGSPLGLTDFETHAPPVSGRYAYNAFRPATLGFPARGRTYVDPVFGTTIRRITDSFPKLPESPIYSKNGWWNADGKRFTHKINGQMVAVDSTTGAVVVSLPNGDLTRS